MRKTYLTYIFTLILFLMPIFINNVTATVSKNWGIEEGDTIEFTAGYDLNITFPNTVWDTIDNKLWVLFNDSLGLFVNESGIPEDEIFDTEEIFIGFKNNSPSLIHFELEITDIYNTEEFEEKDEGKDILTAYDNINASFKVKLPNDTTYNTLDVFLTDHQNNIITFIESNFPTAFGDHMINNINETLPIFEQLIQEISIVSWATSSNSSSDLIDLMLSIGVGNDGLLSSSFPLCVPQDMDFITTFETFNARMQEEGLSLDDIIRLVGITKFEVLKKKIDLEFNYTEMDNDIAILTGLRRQINYFLGNLSNLGINLNPNSINCNAKASFKWDTKGILDNFHFEGLLTAITVNEEPISMKVIFDISQGIFDEINKRYNVYDDSTTISGYKIEFFSLVTLLSISILIVKIRKK